MKYKINVYVEPRYPLSKPLLISAAEASLRAANVKSKVELSISVVGDRKIRQLNRQFRGKDEPTDILAFSYTLDSGKSDSFPQPETKHLNLGDIVISYPQLLNRAAEEDMLVDDTAKFLVIHGVLHLLGYDHEKDEEAKVMESLEDKIFAEIN